MQFSETNSVRNKQLVKIPSSWHHWAYLIALKLSPSFWGDSQRFQIGKYLLKGAFFLSPSTSIYLKKSYYHSMQFIGGLFLFKGCNKHVGQHHGCGHLLHRNLVFVLRLPLQTQPGAATMAGPDHRPGPQAQIRQVDQHAHLSSPTVRLCQNESFWDSVE